MLRAFWERFWMPPRAHGEVLQERRVSYVELFYDLVFVVVVARAAHALAHEVSWSATGHFIVIFSMVWILWFNGTLYYELHGREDGRTRTFVFIEMTLIAILAVFTEGAAGAYSRQFALAYAVLLAIVTMYWWGVLRQDAPQYRARARRYIALMAIGVVMVGASVLAPQQARIWVWTAFAVFWIGATLLTFIRQRPGGVVATQPTESLVERFDLFTILVLGEVVAGVVAGLSGAETTTMAIVSAIFGMVLAFAFWWLYFDFIARTVPADDPRLFGAWIIVHLPIAGAIAAAGAAVVSLVAHSDEGRVPAPTAWLLGGAMAIFLLAIAGAMRVLTHGSPATKGRQVITAVLLVAALAVLAVSALRPVGWLFTLLLVLIASIGWVIGAVRSVAHGTAPSPDGP